MIKKYRMYVDEVGNSDLKASVDSNHRYLSLTGVVFDFAYVKEVVSPQIENLKQKYFYSHPDDPVIFHRKELVNKKYPFHSLRDLEVEKKFNLEFLDFLERTIFFVLTVVMDKLEFCQQYTVWRKDPYHYCLEVLVERFVLHLQSIGAVGDVMAESRRGKEDIRLKDAFHNLYL